MLYRQDKPNLKDTGVFDYEWNTASCMHCGHITLIGLMSGIPSGAEQAGHIIA